MKQIGTEKIFQILSYTAVFCGFLSLWVSGTFGAIESLAFLAIMVFAWLLEGSRWQISERIGTALIVLAIPAFYLLWKLNVFTISTSTELLPGLLGRLILSLTAIKLLQKKGDRDWIFLYLMAFFEVLLAAGLSISMLYFASFILYSLVMVSTIILFEVKRTAKWTEDRASVVSKDDNSFNQFSFRRLPTTSILLIVLIIAIAAPIFFALPRVGSAGYGGSNGGLNTASGFSDTVRLGGIGKIQQNDAVVMRVQYDNSNVPQKTRRWRGVALDTFDGLSWSKSKGTIKEPFAKDDRGLIQVDFASGRDTLVQQTIYLEPLDTPVIFSLPHMIAIQSDLPYVFRDKYGSITFQGRGERISYKALSDVSGPTAAQLRNDVSPYPMSQANYLQLPDSFDHRIADLAVEFTKGTTNRYDAAAAIENHLQNDFGYTLEQKASGDQPLSDFLFNVRQGHCEYFATAMAIMLRTQGIEARIVNGFSQGEYNDTADFWVIRQLNAHSWVEVYFPATDTWQTFDPTPFGGQGGGAAANGIGAGFTKYMEALETFWIQYFVAFDGQGQRSLMTSIRRGFISYQESASDIISDAKTAIVNWWSEVRGDKGFNISVWAIAKGALYFTGLAVVLALFVWSYRKIVNLKVWRRLYDRLFKRRVRSAVEFYDRMVRTLAKRGIVRADHQTPLEFAYEIGMPEAVKITQKYNGVRFGENNVSEREAEEIEHWLADLNNLDEQ